MFDNTTQYEARDDDGNVTSTLDVHVVTEEEDGEYVNTTGGYQQVHPGNVLVANGNRYDVFPSTDALADLHYAAVDSTAPVSTDTADAEDAPADVTSSDPAGAPEDNTGNAVPEPQHAAGA